MGIQYTRIMIGDCPAAWELGAAEKGSERRHTPRPQALGQGCALRCVYVSCIVRWDRGVGRREWSVVCTMTI